MSVTIPIYDDAVPLLPVFGNTPFGYYDTDNQFNQDAGKFIKFAARKLGYPISRIELQDINFYAALEEAITTYGKEIFEYKIRENYISLEGASNANSYNNALLTPTMGSLIRIAENYGSEAGVGGRIEWKKGSLNMTASIQDYDLDEWAYTTLGLSGSHLIEVKEVFYQAPPAIIRYFDPYAGTGTGLQSLMDTFGFGQFSPGINFMLMPINFDVMKLQAIEFNDQIRKSAYSFNIVNNKLKIFPVPSFDRPLYFRYALKSDLNNPVVKDDSGIITNMSNVPYNNPTYSEINSVGKQWIFQYALALTKEILGNVRNKYTQIPIPNADVTLNGPDLINQSSTEKLALIEQLRATLDDTSRTKQLEKKQSEADYLRNSLLNVPMVIYIG
jgi:hypothetical protein